MAASEREHEIRVRPMGDGYQLRVGDGAVPEILSAEEVVEQVRLRLSPTPPEQDEGVPRDIDGLLTMHERALDDAAGVVEELRFRLARTPQPSGDTGRPKRLHEIADRLESTGDGGYADYLRRLAGDTGLETQPCGHPRSDIMSTDEGTSYCAGCERDARQRFTGSEGREDLAGALMRVAHRLRENQTEIESDVREVLRENLWDLYDATPTDEAERGEVDAVEDRTIDLARGEVEVEGAYHWRDGWSFARLPDTGDVRVRYLRRTASGGPCGLEHVVDETIPADEWASIVHAMMPEGTDYYDLQRMHAGTVPHVMPGTRTAPSGEVETEDDDLLQRLSRLEDEQMRQAGYLERGARQRARAAADTIGDAIERIRRSPSPPSEPEGEIMWLNREPCQGRHAEPMYAVIEDDWIQDGMEHLRAEPGWERVRVIPTPPSSAEPEGEG